MGLSDDRLLDEFKVRYSEGQMAIRECRYLRALVNFLLHDTDREQVQISTFLLAAYPPADIEPVPNRDEFIVHRKD